MKSEVRMDRMAFGKPERLSNGHLRVPITATRVGIFVYRKDDGSEWREFRPPEEVFHPESMASLRSVPATNNHPNEGNGLLTADNTTKFMVGYTSDEVRRVDDLLATNMTIVEADTIREVDAGDKREVSCGYKCDIELKAGNYRGQRYDAIQRNIRYNHVAICKNARGGSQVRIHLDSQEQVLRLDSVLGPDEFLHGEPVMEKTLVIDGVEFKVSADAHSAITGKFNKDHRALSDAQETQKKTDEEKQKLQARHDSLETENKKLKEAAAGSGDGIRKDSDEFKAAVKARVALERFASDRLDSELDKLTDRQIIVELIKLDSPDFKEEGKTDVYLQARLDAMIEAGDDNASESEGEDDGEGQSRQDSNAGGRNRQSAYNTIRNGSRTDSKNNQRGREKSHDEVRADAMQAQQERWKQPLGASRKQRG